jgi:hypothetical protein
MVQHHGAAAPELNDIKNVIGGDTPHTLSAGMVKLFIKDRTLPAFGLTDTSTITLRNIDPYIPKQEPIPKHLTKCVSL